MYRLVRNFSVLSAGVIALVSAVLLLANTWHDHRTFIKTKESWNVDVAHSLYNLSLQPFTGFFAESAGLTREDLLARPETSDIDRLTSEALAAIAVLKLKIFNPDGTTIFSSEHRQIGDRISRGSAFFRARDAGLAQSELASGKSMVALSGPVTNLDVLATYVPIKDARGDLVALFEIYTDISQSIATHWRDLALQVACVLCSLGLLYLVLLGIVLHADGVLVRQHAALEGFNRDLEQRVAERTVVADGAAEAARSIAGKLEAEVGERRRAERELREQREALLRQQNTLGALIRRDGEHWSEPSIAIRRLIEVTTDTLGVARAGVTLLVDGHRLVCGGMYDRTTGDYAQGGQMDLLPNSPFVAALQAEPYVAAFDVRSDARLAEFVGPFFAPLDIHSVLDVPIMRDGRVAGFFRVGSVGETRAWTAGCVAFATSMASLVALVFEEHDRMTVEQTLRSTNAKLEKATRVKTQFLATMSHEIRTPMNGVLGMIGQVMKEPLSATQKRYASIALQSGESLLAIIDDILDLTRLESGKLRLETVPFDLREVIDDVVALLAPQAAAKGVQCTASIDHEPAGAETTAARVRRTALGDPTRLRQVLLNLLGNALKFTERGRVDVRVRWPVDSSDARQLRIEVTDTGIGISRAAQAELFQHFNQADTSTSRRFGGTGLGLAISRQLVELMGGQIGVISAEGVGSTFWVELPFAVTSRDAMKVTRLAIEPVQLPHGLRVLVAEDNAVNQMLVQMLLEEQGCVVDVVSDGLEAVNAVRTRQPYDFVLMDIQMPNLDGIAATRIVRNLSGPIAEIPIIALSANVMDSDRDAYREGGLDGFAAKPIRTAELFAEIVRVLQAKTPPVAFDGLRMTA